MTAKCEGCGHEHAGPEWGGICIGCPCEIRAASDEPTEDDGGFADCRSCGAVMVVDLENRGVKPLFYGEHCDAEQVFKRDVVRLTERNVLAAMVAIEEKAEREAARAER
jgi:hypothetical protein